jgi:hypothetical protein
LSALFRPYDLAYVDKTKIERLFSKLSSEIIAERNDRSEKGTGVGPLGLELESILAKLGLGTTAARELNSDYPSIMEIMSNVSIANKLNAVLIHGENHGRVARADLAAVDYSQLVASANATEFQILTGVFHPLIDAQYPVVGYPTHGNGELLSETKAGTKESLVRVPLLWDHLWPNQLFFHYLRARARSGEGLRLCISGSSAATEQSIVLDPMAIWLEY